MAPPRGPEPVTWGASPSFTEEPHARVWSWSLLCTPGASPGGGRRDTPPGASIRVPGHTLNQFSVGVTWPGGLPLFQSPRFPLAQPGVGEAMVAPMSSHSVPIP